MATIFSKIIAGEIPCYKVAEDDQCLAFLDIRPVVYGHTLVIPKKEIDYIFDLEDQDLAYLHIFAKKVAHALRSEVDCIRIGVMVAGLEVPHAHIHLMPIKAIADLSFINPKVNVPAEEMEKLAARIALAFKGMA